MEQQLQVYKARVEQVVDHATLRVYIDLSFGLSIERVVRVADAPSVDRARAITAKVAMVTLCGGKKVTLLAMSEQYGNTIDARVGLTCREPPVGLEMRTANATLLDLGLALVRLGTVAFSKTETLRLSRANDEDADTAPQ